MRIALIADIHANLVALDAALDAIEAIGVDEIVCLGDVAATGPQPRPTLERLAGLGCPVVMGNADAFLLDPKPVATADEGFAKIIDMDLWCAGRLEDEHRRFVRSFRPTIEVDMADRRLLCFHGSPRSYDDVIRSTTPDETVTEMLAGADASWMAGGHTHFQMLRRHARATLVNPGSVGLAYDRMPLGEPVLWSPKAEFALLDESDGAVSIAFHRVAYDFAALEDAARRSGMPHVDWWRSEWDA